MNEVFPGIFLIVEKGAFGSIKPPENIYILAGDDGLIFDAGYGGKKTINYLIKEIRKIEKIYTDQQKEFNLARILPSHTHPDHFSGLGLIRKHLGVKIILTEKMAEIIKNGKNYTKYNQSDIYSDLYRVKNLKNRIRRGLENKFMNFFYYLLYRTFYINDPDIIIEEESELMVNGEKWKILPSPGHCISHISLYNEKKGVLLSGDNILQTITTWLGPPTSDINDYLNTIRTIQNLPNLKMVLPAHGNPVENPRERIQEILAHREERKEQVKEIIDKNYEKGVSVNEIVRILYQNEGRAMYGIARGWVCLTVKTLEQENLVKHAIKKNKIVFFPIDPR
jgi:glyoxylase-like metal-dependent hydrolase (beta-lactamase superfamily II)